MLKNILNLKGAQQLSKKEQNAIYGGAKFTCYCGFVGNPLSDPFPVTANNISDALDGAGGACQGLGATCSGGIQ